MLDAQPSLAADFDADAGHIRATATPVLAIRLVLTNSGYIGMIDAFRHAGFGVADLPADPLGIGRMRKSEPKSGSRHANQNFAHNFDLRPTC